MDPRDRRRLAITHRILDALRNKSFRSDTLATGTGDHVIVPALPDDNMAALFNQVRQSGGPVHVATLHDDALAVFAMVPCKPARHAYPQISEDDEFPMNPEMSVGIVVDYLIFRNRPLLFRNTCPQVSLELVENPDDRPAPAPLAGCPPVC